MEITHDPATWPTGSKVWNVCRAIAIAEGANVQGSNPDRLNNPGDISDGREEFGDEFHTGSHVTHFPTKEIGWQWLHNKVQNAASGHSHVFLPSMTWIEIAHEWAGDWEDWVKNVTRELNVDPTNKFGDYFL